MEKKIKSVNEEYKRDFRYIEKEDWIEHAMEHRESGHVFNYRTSDLPHDHYFIGSLLDSTNQAEVPLPNHYYRHWFKKIKQTYNSCIHSEIGTKSE